MYFIIHADMCGNTNTVLLNKDFIIEFACQKMSLQILQSKPKIDILLIFVVG